MLLLDATPRAVSKTGLGLVVGPLDAKLWTTPWFSWQTVIGWSLEWRNWMLLILLVPKLVSDHRS